MPELAIILVNYKRSADTIECLRSLYASTYTDFAVFVVDNSSGDGSAEQIRAAYPAAVVIENADNLGFCLGNTTGMERARAIAPQYYLLLNNDTVVDPAAIEVLVRTMRDRPAIGACGPKILYFDKPDVIWFAGGKISMYSGRATHRGLLERDMHQYDNEFVCDYISGCALMFRAELYDAIGGLDPDYFAYFEDADYCARIGRTGKEILYQPAAKIFHKVSTTSGWDSPVYLYFTLRNRLLFLQKNSSLAHRALGIPVQIYFYARQFIRLLVKWRNIPGARAAWYGLVDGLRTSPGAHGKGRLDILQGRS